MKIQLSLIALLSSILLISCNSVNHKQDLEVLTQRIQYEVTIKSPDVSFDWWVQNIEGSRRENFVKTLIQAVYDGKIETYDNFGTKLTIDDVRKIESSIDTFYMTSDKPPYNDSLVINKRTLEVGSITKFSFLEEWKYNKSSFEINKRVLGFAPLIEKFDKEGDLMGNKPLFWVYFDETYPEEITGIVQN